MKMAERIVMVVIVFVLVAGSAWFYFSIQQQQAAVRDAVADGEYERPVKNTVGSYTAETDWRVIFPFTVPIMIGDKKVEASVADTLSSRIKGLSDTPYLPDHVVKLFAFGVEGEHSIWMKNMHYALDIMWVSKEGYIVHIEEQVAPDTYPEAFSSPVPAWYVVEANAGFVASSSIIVGDQVVLPVSR